MLSTSFGKTFFVWRFILNGKFDLLLRIFYQELFVVVFFFFFFFFCFCALFSNIYHKTNFTAKTRSDLYNFKGFLEQSLLEFMFF